ncbi:MAG: ribulose-phosphate 3-epimerase [Armatimonadetes bacterium]|nr:ribulose-phosphate 3-epimerase [Armatimonadota bacterium]
MKPEMAPSILSCDPGRLREAVAELIEGGADRIHFDVMDGQFVPPITFGADLVKSLRDLGQTVFEAHLMTHTPEAHFEAFIEAGCGSIIFHQEASSHSHRLLQGLKQRGVRAGIAINPGTPVEAVEPVLGLADLVLVMTVNPGWGGQKFIGSALEKVSQIRALCPEIDIEVDGGIGAETIRRAWEAGANVFVAGNFLVRSTSLAAGLEELRSRCA